MLQGRAKGGTLLLLALGLAAGFAFQGSRGLYESTEGRYAEVGREMLETGHYLEPTLAYRPHWSKPPATYWMVAAGLAVFGRNAWGARAGNALAFCLAALAVAAIGTTLWRPEVGLAAGLIYVSSPFPFIGASVLSADTLLTLWEILAVLAYVKARAAAARLGAVPAAGGRVAGGPAAGGPAAGGSARGRAWVAAMWLCFGLGFFTKGPPALLPLLPLFLFHGREKRPFSLITLPGLALFAASAGWWYALVIARHPELLRHFIGDEILARSLTDRFHRNPQWYAPALIYLPALVLGQGVWLASGVRSAKRRALLRPREVLRAAGQRGAPSALLLLWLLLPLVVFSLSRSRLAGYVLPLYAPIALALARARLGGTEAGAADREGPDRAGPDRERPDRAGPTRTGRARAGLARVRGLALVSVAALLALKAGSTLVRAPADMARLYDAVAGRGDVWLYAEPGLAGLQFYLDGRLRRASASGEEAWADGSLEDLVASAAAVRGTSATIILTAPRDVQTLAAALDRKRLTYRRSRAGSLEMFALTAPSAVPTGS